MATSWSARSGSTLPCYDKEKGTAFYPTHDLYEAPLEIPFEELCIRGFGAKMATLLTERASKRWPWCKSNSRLSLTSTLTKYRVNLPVTESQARQAMSRWI
jgi:hypothetical protein